MRKQFATALGVVISLATVLLLDGCAAPADPALVPQFAVSQRATLGGAGGWDFISFESARRRLFISRSDRVQVWSAATGQVIGEIAQTEGVHGIALAPELGRGFTSNGRSNSVTAFALDDLKVLAKVVVPGGNPDAILYEPVFKRVYVFNGASHDVSVLDAMTLRVITTIPLGGKPEVGVSDDTGAVFVNIEDTSEIVALDPKSSAVSARWKLAPCEEPTGLAIDTAHSRLFSVCANKLMVVVDSRSGQIISQVPIDAEPDGAAFDPALGIAWSSNGAGTLTMVRSDGLGQYHAVATVTTRPRARTLALDPATHRIYLASATFGVAPAPTAATPRPRAPMLPDSFEVIVVAPR